MDVAVAARARARVAEDLERRRSAAPALADVRAARLLADRVQAGAVDQLADVVVARVGTRRAHLHPVGPARAVRDWQGALHPASLVLALRAAEDRALEHVEDGSGREDDNACGRAREGDQRR